MASPSLLSVSQTGQGSTCLNLLLEKNKGHSAFHLSTTIKNYSPTELDGVEEEKVIKGFQYFSMCLKCSATVFLRRILRRDG